MQLSLNVDWKLRSDARENVLYESIDDMKSFTMKQIHDSVPEECELTLEHVQIHLSSAKESKEMGDTEQVIHDMHMAGKILLAMVYKADKERGDYD